MKNYSLKLNLLKFRNACVVSVKGKSSTKKGIFIPIEDNGLFVSPDDNLNAKSAYADLAAWETRESRYGDTHGIKLSLPKEMREKMTDEELKAIPYIGNMKPLEASNASSSVNVQVEAIPESEEFSSLPF